MKVLNGFCPSCGESVAVDVFVTGMEHDTERLLNGTFRSWLVPSVLAGKVSHECRTEAQA